MDETQRGAFLFEASTSGPSPLISTSFVVSEDDASSEIYPVNYEIPFEFAGKLG